MHRPLSSRTIKYLYWNLALEQGCSVSDVALILSQGGRWSIGTQKLLRNLCYLVGVLLFFCNMIGLVLETKFQVFCPSIFSSLPKQTTHYSRLRFWSSFDYASSLCAVTNNCHVSHVILLLFIPSVCSKREFNSEFSIFFFIGQTSLPSSCLSSEALRKINVLSIWLCTTTDNLRMGFRVLQFVLGTKMKTWTKPQKEKVNFY